LQSIRGILTERTKEINSETRREAYGQLHEEFEHEHLSSQMTVVRWIGLARLLGAGDMR